ncbi:MAG: endolytic transglycosylase MltG [Clostridia bacterium]|nr:endolytic transglycosylase MltG [Clostridia bacterium]
MAIHTVSESAKPSRRIWKVVAGIMVVLILVALGLGLYGYNYYQQALEPVKAEGVEEKITIHPGSSTVRIANLLWEKNLIREPNMFRLYTRINNYDGRLKAGEYILSGTMSTPEIVAKIVAGTVVTYPFTIPEGYTLKQIAKVLSDKGMVDEELFIELLERGSFDFPYLDQLLEGANRFEGFLFPDTYYITSYMTEKDIIQMMLNRFLKVVTPEVVKTVADQGLSLLELVTIAAMIERESSVDADSPKIAGVIYNRLAIGMPLQIDATVIYAHGEHINRVLHKHLEIDSPYNTYKYPGIPLGPIAAPGAKSIMAALEPEEHNFYYYVLKPDGSHHFSRNLSEHNRAVQQYLRNR